VAQQEVGELAQAISASRRRGRSHASLDPIWQLRRVDL
jgi:2-polyprenyl-6-methoxyphenol hydroxylase-like FAD-dependent oxidoreductase